MDIESAVCFWVLYRRMKRRQQRRRRYWVHPILRNRLTNSLYITLYPNLRQHGPKFFNYFRMSTTSFDALLALIRHEITASVNAVRYCISPEEKLIITLRYLASGCSMGELHYSYKIGRSTVAGIIHEVCKVLWRELKTVVMEIPTADKWREIANGFEKHAKFPNCIGAIDGKHIRLFQPAQSASLYYNYKHFFSLLLLALCDANYCFTWVDIGAYGKNSDSGVFQESTLYRMLMEKTLNIPEPTAITGGSIVPYVIVGDEAFALMENLMKPFGGKLLTYEKKIFNYRLTLARRYIECTFGIMCNKWRILHRPLDVNINFAEDIVKAICVLHNYVRQRDGSTFEETLYTAPLTNLQQSSTRRTGRVTENVRNKFMHYFVNEGKVDWQNSMI
ncbi:uncharacterized protein rasp isoform X5 [Diabrotica undecimpunctata]|uniref:uncharacterized protein rasp isoform X5 n=1 Tax=Diabrotica undecimpunctata TaxID=50387 RepID=UPI003B642719